MPDYYWLKEQLHFWVCLNTLLGELEGVEKARARVRELTPLIFYFDLPIMTSLQDSAVDTNDPFLKTVQDQYNVQVLIIGIKWFRIRSKIYKWLYLWDDFLNILLQKKFNFSVKLSRETKEFSYHYGCCQRLRMGSLQGERGNSDSNWPFVWICSLVYTNNPNFCW